MPRTPTLPTTPSGNTPKTHWNTHTATQKHIYRVTLAAVGECEFFRSVNSHGALPKKQILVNSVPSATLNKDRWARLYSRMFYADYIYGSFQKNKEAKQGLQIYKTSGKQSLGLSCCLTRQSRLSKLHLDINKCQIIFIMSSLKLNTSLQKRLPPQFSVHSQNEDV